MLTRVRFRRLHPRRKFEAAVISLITAGLLVMPTAGWSLTGSADSAPDTLDSLAPAVEILRPIGGEVFQAAAAETLRWTIAEHSWNAAAEPVNLQIYDDAELLWQATVAAEPGGSYSYVWSVPTGVETDAAHLQVVAVDRFGWAGQDSGGDFTLEDLISAVPGPLAVDGLGPVFPNPFNPQATIAFSLRRAGDIELAIYDLRGRRVVTLAAGPWPAGAHDIVWRGRDARGQVMPSGTYFARLTIHNDSHDDKRLVTRLTLVK